MLGWELLVLDEDELRGLNKEEKKELVLQKLQVEEPANSNKEKSD